MNEPAFNDMMITHFIQHFTLLINQLDETHFTCVGGAASTPHTDGLGNLTVLTYHDYNGAEDGGKLAAGVAAAQKLGKALHKPTMLTECFGRGSRSDDPAKRKWDDPKVAHTIIFCLPGAAAPLLSAFFFCMPLRHRDWHTAAG